VIDSAPSADGLTLQCRAFDRLDNQSLYDLLALRIAVFCVEQNCAYQEADGKDTLAWHILAHRHGELVGTARLLMPGVSYPDACSIGRVANRADQRGQKIGQQIMAYAISQCEQLFANYPIRLGAQHYLIGFYQQFGFVVQGERYLEDGIVHIEMERPAIA
jgi:ElaA protein